MRERSSESNALLLAARELVRHPRLETDEPDHVEQLVAPAPPLGRLHFSDRERKLDILGDRHVAEERVMLKDEPHTALLRRKTGDVPPVEEYAPLVHIEKPGDHPKNGALPASARTEQDEELAVCDLDRDVADDPVASEDLREMFQDNRHGTAPGFVRRVSVLFPQSV